jgi:hypothetical protein
MQGFEPVASVRWSAFMLASCATSFGFAESKSQRFPSQTTSGVTPA